MAIIWDPAKMSTDVANIDSEHQEWIRRFNDFDTAVSSGHGVDLIDRLLLFMLEYADTHFLHEEALMVNMNPLATKLNLMEHKKFRQRMVELRTRIETHGASAFDVDALRTDLQDWLVNHICTVDVKIWRE